MKVADDRHRLSSVRDALRDLGHRRGCLVVVDRDPDELRTRACQRHDLLCRGRCVGSVGVGHRLHHNGVRGSDRDATDVGGDGSAAEEQKSGGQGSGARGRGTPTTKSYRQR